MYDLLFALDWNRYDVAQLCSSKNTVEHKYLAFSSLSILIDILSGLHSRKSNAYIEVDSSLKLRHELMGSSLQILNPIFNKWMSGVVFLILTWLLWQLPFPAECLYADPDRKVCSALNFCTMISWQSLQFIVMKGKKLQIRVIWHRRTCGQAYDALGLYHGVARTWLNPASVRFLYHNHLITFWAIGHVFGPLCNSNRWNC